MCNTQTKQLEMEASYLLLPLSLSCLRSIVGRRLKAAAQTRNGEEEQPVAAWGHRERSGKKDVILKPGSAAVRAQCEDQCHMSSRGKPNQY